MIPISVVIPTYERTEFLNRLLTSISKQTFRDFEVVVIDDASPSHTENRDLVEWFKNQLPAVSYCCNEHNLGACRSRNLGIERAQGKWVALVDDDDEWKEEKLSKQFEIASKQSKELALIYTWTEAINAGQVTWRYRATFEGNPIRELLLECFIPSPSVLVRKDVLLEVGGFDSAMPSCQDWDLWIRILAKGYHCSVVKSFETLYHKHDLPSIGKRDEEGRGHRLFIKKHQSLYRKHHFRIFMKQRMKCMLSRLGIT